MDDELKEKLHNILQACRVHRPLPYIMMLSPWKVMKLTKIAEGSYGEIYLVKNADGSERILKIIGVYGSPRDDPTRTLDFEDAVGDVICTKKMEHGEDNQISSSITRIKNRASLILSKYNELNRKATLSERTKTAPLKKSSMSNQLVHEERPRFGLISATIVDPPFTPDGPSNYFSADVDTLQVVVDPWGSIWTTLGINDSDQSLRNLFIVVDRSTLSASSVKRLANQRLHLGRNEVSDWLDARHSTFVRLGVNEPLVLQLKYKRQLFRRLFVATHALHVLGERKKQDLRVLFLSKLTEPGVFQAPNFPKAFSIDLVKGKAPKRLVDAWQRFQDNPNTEATYHFRPDRYTPESLFLIMELENCGDNLPSTAAVDFLHHENSPKWARVEPSILGAEGRR
ncbi:hypothetical protein TNCV_1994241 [Trichonephila clavipes]|nr:hypothetical protein TNCV_1994241 [Trichonephila clavipes]